MTIFKTKVFIKDMEEIVGKADDAEMSDTAPISSVQCTDTYFATSIELLDRQNSFKEWLTVSFLNFM